MTVWLARTELPPEQKPLSRVCVTHGEAARADTNRQLSDRKWAARKQFDGPEAPEAPDKLMSVCLRLQVKHLRYTSLGTSGCGHWTSSTMELSLATISWTQILIPALYPSVWTNRQYRARCLSRCDCAVSPSPERCGRLCGAGMGIIFMFHLSFWLPRATASTST